MSDEFLKVSVTEKPDKESADTSVSLESDTLERQAKSASYRDVHERSQHLVSLNRRIDVLQGKLDAREEELRDTLPRLAKLAQASKVSKVLVRDGTIILAVGGGLVSASSLFIDGGIRFLLAGGGGALLMCGLWVAKILNRNAWPDDD